MLNSIKAAAICSLISLSTAVAAETFEVSAGRSRLVFDRGAGLPIRWLICEADCSVAGVRQVELIAPGDGEMRVLSPQGPGGNFSSEVEQDAAEVIVRFQAVYETRVYRISRDTGRIRLELSAGSEVRIATGSHFVPEQLPGIGAIYSRVELVDVTQSGQQTYTADDLAGSVQQAIIEKQGWLGVRNRYWTWLVSPHGVSLNADLQYMAQDRPSLTVTPNVADQPLQLDIYAGPVEWRELRQVSPVLTEMLFAALWDFLRWLCFGMLLLLEFLHGLVGNFGVAIILLSLSAKVLMLPLTRLADRWQADVNSINSLLQPEVAAVKKQYKGEEAHRRILVAYKTHDVSQWYTFKSAAGFLIQIPVFIAAFDMLAENFALNAISFLWITDLAKPDQLAQLPFEIPFFGGWLNFLPFLMVGLSLLAARLQEEKTLTPELQQQQSLRLYLMAAAFFVLFYTFPAGMVLYWTSSNLFHLLKVELAPLLKRML